MITLPMIRGICIISEINLELNRLGERTLQINVLEGPLKGQSFEGWDYFSSLKGLRIELEMEGLKIGCVGSLRNFYPSNMAMDMGQGKIGYLMTLGKKAGRKDIAKTFDQIDNFSDLASVEEQALFYQKWRDSLKIAT